MRQSNIASTDAAIHKTLGRVNARFEWVDVGVGARGEGWVRTSEIVHDPGAVSGLLDEVCRLYAMDDRQVGASFLVLGYFWTLMTGAVGCYLLEQRVPDLAGEAVARSPEGNVAFLSDCCWALPGDPASNHAAVQVVANLDDLRAQLVSQLEEHHARPLFDTLRSVAPLGKNAMWTNYVDRLVHVVLWLAEQLNDNERARRIVHCTSRLRPSRLRGGPRQPEDACRVCRGGTRQQDLPDAGARWLLPELPGSGPGEVRHLLPAAP